MIVFGGDLYVYGDPCHWASTTPDTPATTVDELVAALAAQASRDASAPVDITVDGYAGKSITLHVPDDAVFSDCDRDTFGSWTVSLDSAPGLDPYRYHQGPGQIDEDVDPGRERCGYDPRLEPTTRERRPKTSPSCGPSSSRPPSSRSRSIERSRDRSAGGPPGRPRAPRDVQRGLTFSAVRANPEPSLAPGAPALRRSGVIAPSHPAIQSERRFPQSIWA